MNSGAAQARGDWRQDSQAAGPTDPGAPPLVVDDDFARAHLPFVTRSLRRMGVPYSDVEDASQEVMLAALRRAHTFESGRSPRAWIFGITRLTARKMYRRAREVCMAEPPEAPVAPNQEHALHAKRARSMVHRALAALPEEQRDVLILHKLEGWPMKRVAEAVGCPMPTAYSRLRLGHARIARSIRGGVLRARFAAAAAALLGLFAGHSSAAAAVAAVSLILGGAIWVRHAEPVNHVGTPNASAQTHERQRAAGARRAPRAPTERALDPQPQEVVAPAATRAEEQRAPQREAASPPQRPATRPRRSAAAPLVPEAPMDPQEVVAPAAQPTAPQQPTPAAAAAPTPLPDTLAAPTPSAQAELDALVVEGRLLRRARSLATHDRAAAREALRAYDLRFPAGRLHHEAEQLRLRLGR